MKYFMLIVYDEIFLLKIVVIAIHFQDFLDLFYFHKYTLCGPTFIL